jgi:sigma-B regulation protein RsbU (phosphoserine phosphatase)
MSASDPIQPYRQALEQLRREGEQAPLAKRLSELISLLELTTTLNSGAASEELLAAALRIVMAELQVERGALFVRGEDGTLVLRAGHGLPAGAPATLALDAPLAEPTVTGPSDEARVRHGLELLCPIERHGGAIAVLGLGPLREERAYWAEERSFLRSVAACAAAPIENSLVSGELRRSNQKLSVKVFQLHNLFDISRELSGGFDEDVIQGLVATTALGHFLVSRCALYLMGPAGLALVHQRGMAREDRSAAIPPEEARAALLGLVGPMTVTELPPGPLRRRLEEARLALAVPLAAGSRVEGVLAIGERASRTPFSEEDRDFAQALARQALAALENARASRLRVEKQRQDQELQIAREIQRSLFPPRRPEIPGFEVAAESRSCFEVGGDLYDWISLGSGRLALVIGDVSGKGTPASLLMASVHAYVHALAGTGPPAAVVGRLNRFLYASTQASRFVTFFYAELDARSRRLAYVNAGHIPPYRIARDGTLTRLSEGGPALGLLDQVAYDSGEVRLEPGDTVAMVTDGVTDASSPDDHEFGDERVWASLRAPRGGAAGALDALISAATAWAGAAGFGDDLTALVLRASVED